MGGLIGVCIGLAGCSTSVTSPEQVQVMPMIGPAQVALPPVIMVPPPEPVHPAPTAPPMAERRNAVLKVGKPYQVAGNWYYPSTGAGYSATGVASWYGPQFHGHATANGEIYNMRRLTAAHPTLPMPCYVTVTNLDNGRNIVVRINDRGPYKRGRIIDLSQRAASLLGFTRSGTARVRVSYLKPAPLFGDDSFEEQFLSHQAWYQGPRVAAAAKAKPVAAPGEEADWSATASALGAADGSEPQVPVPVPVPVAWGASVTTQQ